MYFLNQSDVPALIGGGLGLTPEYNVNWMCNSTGSICGSKNSPEMNTLLLKMQELTNYFSGALKFSPIAVDGVVGAGTVAAVRKVMNYLSSVPEGSVRPSSDPNAQATVIRAAARSLIGASASPRALTEKSHNVVATLALARDMVTTAAPPSHTPPAPPRPTSLPPAGGVITYPPGGLPGVMLPTTGAAANISAHLKAHWWKYAIGGLALVGIVMYVTRDGAMGAKPKPIIDVGEDD